MGSGELEFEGAGSPRGLSTAVELFVVATPSLAAFSLLIEKLRRLRLPRTYVKFCEEEVEVWVDEKVRDGRTLALRCDGSLIEELSDPELSTQQLISLFSRSKGE